jgi:hypothetical protein
MKRITLLLAIAALVLPAGALAKGPSKATIEGPGLGKAIVITGAEAPGTPLMNFAERAGFFPAVFSQTPDPMLPDRPSGNLGPKYSVEYTVPGPEGETYMIDQDLYPYAKPYGATYMKSGQKIFELPGGTRGGWFSDAELKNTVVAAGLPAKPVATAPESSSFFSGGRLGALAGIAALLIAIGSVVVMRRRRPGPAA